MMTLEDMGKKAKETALYLNTVSTRSKNTCLEEASREILRNESYILEQNALDMEQARSAGMKESLQDRLRLTPARIKEMAEGLQAVANLDDPVGEVLYMKQRPNGLIIGQKRVPIGVIGIIYESRPNVTADAFALCFKTSNAVILKGGKDAIHSNTAIVEVLRRALTASGVQADAVQLITSTDRETTNAFMKMNAYVDVLIPRGGASLIQAVVQNSTIPVIQTGTGNCHVFVDATADFDMAINIILNGKLQRPGACNAVESLVIHQDIAQSFIPVLAERLALEGVEMVGDSFACRYSDMIFPATEEDFRTEYLDLKLSVKTVSGIDEAIAHINRVNTGHSEAIVTKDYHNAQRFLQEIDAAAVYVNASTRFTDGFMFGFGAEIGISTQKLHARGPMGLKELTSTKYIIYGDGQVR